MGMAAARIAQANRGWPLADEGLEPKGKSLLHTTKLTIDSNPSLLDLPW
jgi:hypothetical protein